MFETVKEFLSGLPGVIDVARVKKDDIPGILSAEAESGKTRVVKLLNLGVKLVLEREHVFVFIKDAGFRPPPCPTLYMVEEIEHCLPQGSGQPVIRRENPVEGLDSGAEFLRVGGDRYRIIGEEVLDPDTRFEENHFYFQKGFVMFPDRRGKNRSVPAYFLLPPLPFPDLEGEKERFSITNIMSVSPSSPCDDYLRERYRMSKNPAYASILVGCDSANNQV